MNEQINIENLLLPDTQDATVMDENVALTYKFEAFEGPLDLLLSLITKNKIDIGIQPLCARRKTKRIF